jgi:alpha-glucosidase
MLCDYPEAYIGQPGFELLQHIPTIWDETIVPNAQLDAFVTVARRKGNDWYIGTISNHDSREVDINLNFLPEGKYRVTMYSDAADANLNPNHLTKESLLLDHPGMIKIGMAKGGGNVILLTKK